MKRNKWKQTSVAIPTELYEEFHTKLPDANLSAIVCETIRARINGGSIPLPEMLQQMALEAVRKILVDLGYTVKEKQ